MREKGKKKEKKILIRVSKDEKMLAEKLSKTEGKNTSEFFRELLKEKKTVKGFILLFQKIVNQNEKLIKYITQKGLKCKKKS